MNKYRVISPGDPAPWFHTRTSTNPRYAFDSAARRCLVLCFFSSAGSPLSKQRLSEILKHNDVFDDKRVSFFGVSNDPVDESQVRVADVYPGYRYFWDFEGHVAQMYGALSVEADATKGQTTVRPLWVILDPTLRVLKVVLFENDGSDLRHVLDYLASLPPPERFAGIELQAPILVLHNVFEPALCKSLIGLYEKHGGEESGFMREVNGKTVTVHDHLHKRRKDHVITDDGFMQETRARVLRRIVPEIAKVHQFRVTRMERYIVSCYAAEDKAHFNSHRDNTTAGTAHRRFAVSINLNEDFDGGEVYFPEYGQRSFKAPAGGAVVFSCSLLHAVTKVTRGQRYAFLPFLYDDLAAKIREENNKNLGEGVGAYNAAP